MLSIAKQHYRYIINNFREGVKKFTFRGHVPYQGMGEGVDLPPPRKKYSACSKKPFIKTIFLYYYPCLSTGPKEIFNKRKRDKKVDFFCPLKRLRRGGPLKVNFFIINGLPPPSYENCLKFGNFSPIDVIPYITYIVDNLMVDDRSIVDLH